MSWSERLQSIGVALLGLVFFVGSCAIVAGFMLGAAWASSHLVQPLIDIGWCVLAVDILVLLPLSIPRRLRPYTGVLIAVTSYLFGLLVWLVGFALAYTLWGVWAVVIGLFVAGIGVVPVAMLATLFHGMWAGFFALLGLVVLSLGSRFGGLAIAAAGESRRDNNRPGERSTSGAQEDRPS